MLDFSAAIRGNFGNLSSRVPWVVQLKWAKRGIRVLLLLCFYFVHLKRYIMHNAAASFLTAGVETTGGSWEFWHNHTIVQVSESLHTHITSQKQIVGWALSLDNFNKLCSSH